MKTMKFMFTLVMVIAAFAIVSCGAGSAAGTVSPITNLGVPSAQTQTGTPTANIFVNGTGRVFVKPDVAIVVLGAESTQPALSDASADVAKRSTAIVNKVKAMGVSEDDIKTVSYSISPQYSPVRNNTDTPKIIGYRVSNSVQVKIRKLDDVGKIVDAAVTEGANSIGGLSFTIDDPSKAEADARKQAVKNAMDKAKQLTDAAGVKLGDMIYISESVVSPRPQVERFAVAAPAAADAGIGPVQSGQLEVSVTVEIHYTIGK